MKEMRLVHIVGIGAACVLGGLGGMLGWTFMAFLASSILVFLIELLRPKWNDKPWDFLTFFSIMYFLLYVFVPMHLYLDNEQIFTRVKTGNIEVLIAFLMVVVGYLLVVAGYYFRRTEAPVNARLQPELVYSSAHLGMAFLLFGLMSFLVYAQIYGGVSALFRNSDIIRAGYVGNSGFVFFRKFLPFVVFGAWMLIALLNGRKTGLIRKTLIVTVLLAACLLVIFATAGRLDVMFIFIPLMLGPYLLSGKRLPVRNVLVFVGVAAAWVAFGDSIFTYISYGSWSMSQSDGRMYYGIINELTHPFESYLVAVQNVPHAFGLRGLYDIYNGIFSLIPQKLLGLDFQEPISTLNTYLLTGTWKAVIPPGMLGFFFHALSYPGVIIGCFLMGYLMRIFEEYLLNRMKNDMFVAYIHVAFAVSLAHYVMAGDPEVYIQNYFWLISGTIFVFLYARFRNSFASKLKTGLVDREVHRHRLT